MEPQGFKTAPLHAVDVKILLPSWTQLSQGLDHTIFDPKHQEEVWAIFQMNAQILPIALQFHLKG